MCLKNPNSYKQENKYLRAKELALHFSIALSTVWLWRKQGKITAHKISPRVTVFDIEEINALLNLNEIKTCNC